MTDMRPVTHNHSHLWNDLPDDERKRMMPYYIESQILHLEQARAYAVRAHRSQLRELDDWINNCKQSLREAGRDAKP